MNTIKLPPTTNVYSKEDAFQKVAKNEWTIEEFQVWLESFRENAYDDGYDAGYDDGFVSGYDPA